jgi:molybdopterin molybdotransferase
MRTPDEAIAEILRRVEPVAESEAIPIAGALDRILSKDVASDIDLPPFEKSAMDGYAVRSVDFARGTERGAARAPQEFRMVGESRAGAPFTSTVAPRECVAIYTGAQVPSSCDAVVMVEKSSSTGDRVRLDDAPAPGQNVCHLGEDLRVGDVVLRRGRKLSAIELAVLASVGCDPVPVFQRPRVALFTTGDELVPVRAKPGPGEIREGNTFYLAARLSSAGADVLNLGVVRDDERELESSVRHALESCDMLVTTGGVSMGKYDLVGAVLERCGVEPVFHKVAIKPGKPLWFGMRGRVPVFGLPGNPVSCLIGMEVFLVPALARMSGAASGERASALRIGRWAGSATKPNPREQHLPVRVTHGADGVDQLEPIRWTSSADIVGLTRAEALAIAPIGRVLATGDWAAYRPLR